MRGISGIDPRAFRKRRNLWLAYLSELASPVLNAAATMTARGRSSPPSQWRNGLIVGHNHLGDVLYRTCSLEPLRRALPECSWSYLTSPVSAQALKNNASLLEILPFAAGEDSWKLRHGGFLELSARRFDVVLCTNTLRHYPDFALAAALRIPNRAGYIDKGLSGMITHPVMLNFPDSYPAYFRSMVAQIANIDPDWTLRPRIFPDDASRRQAEAAWRGAGFDGSRPVLACTPVTRQPSGDAPRDVLLSILSRARNVLDFDVALCGAPEDLEELGRMAQTLPFEATVLAGRLDVLAFAALLEKCAALLTVDSGPRHLGNAVGLPVLFTRNLAQLRVETGKYCETETDVFPDTAELLTQREIERFASGVSLDAAVAKVVTAIRDGASRASSPVSTGDR